MALNFLQKLGISLICLLGVATTSLAAPKTLNFVVRGRADIPILNKKIEAEERGYLTYGGDTLIEAYLPIPELKFGVGYPILEDSPRQHYLLKRTPEGIFYHDNILKRGLLRPSQTVQKDSVFSSDDEYKIAFRCLADVIRAGLDKEYDLVSALDKYPISSTGKGEMYVNGGFFGGRLKLEEQNDGTNILVRTSESLVPLVGGFDLKLPYQGGVRGKAGLGNIFTASVDVERID